MKLTSQQLKKIKDYFSRQPDVMAVYLYGSYATGNTHKRSDIDFGVLFEKEENLYRRLGQIYSDLADLKLPTEPEARNINLKMSPVYLLNVIQGICVYARDEEDRINFEVRVLRLFYDTQKLREIKRYYMKQRLAEGTYGY